MEGIRKGSHRRQTPERPKGRHSRGEARRHWAEQKLASCVWGSRRKLCGFCNSRMLNYWGRGGNGECCLTKWGEEGLPRARKLQHRGVLRLAAGEEAGRAQTLVGNGRTTLLTGLCHSLSTELVQDASEEFGEENLKEAVDKAWRMIRFQARERRGCGR